MNKKKWYKSKTIWANIGTVVAGLFAALDIMMPALMPVLPPMNYAILLFVIGVLNIWLRTITNEGIE